ncbi:MAG: hypothetical protein KDB03_28935, partial [Planctomycetales bacterium]|nr:hypothetical protein [Planctomycetales bacterium]
LAQRLAQGMREAWLATVKRPLAPADVQWRTVPVRLEPAAHLERAAMVAALRSETPRGYIATVDQLAWLQRCEAGVAIDAACLGLGDVRVLHMPGELFVEYQLAAKAMRPDLHVALAAYGDYGPGYIGTAVAYDQGGYETSPRASGVGPAAEATLMDAMRGLLQEDAAAAQSD